LDLSRSFLLFFRERRKSNVGGRTGRLKGGVNGSISAAGRQQNTEWNSDGKTREAEISRISRAEKSVRFFTDVERSILRAEIIRFSGHYDLVILRNHRVSNHLLGTVISTVYKIAQVELEFGIDANRIRLNYQHEIIRDVHLICRINLQRISLN